MAQQGSARASWEALEEPWHVTIEMAWQSYRDGGIEAGAVLADGAGVVVSEGRNQRFAGRTRGLLAHAEMGRSPRSPRQGPRA